LSLRTKRDRERKKREKPTRETQRERETEEKKKENIFATACLLAFDSHRRLVKRGGDRRGENSTGPYRPRCSAVHRLCPDRSR